jgi:hypothetical protein
MDSNYIVDSGFQLQGFQIPVPPFQILFSWIPGPLCWIPDSVTLLNQIQVLQILDSSDKIVDIPFLVHLYNISLLLFWKDRQELTKLP